jgi:hypothetical protein
MGGISRRDFIAAVPALSVAPKLVAAAVPGVQESRSGQLPPSAILQAAAFSCDITPPLGSPLPECDPPFATSADTPLLAKGVVIADGNTRFALCGFDYCELRTGAHDLFRRAIANALSVGELHVEVHCLHPHDAPLYDTYAELLAGMVPSPPRTTDLEFVGAAAERVASAAREALKRMQPLTHVVCARRAWRNSLPTGASPCRTGPSESA